MPWIWINPSSEPEEMVNAAVEATTSEEDWVEEAYYSHTYKSDSDMGLLIAKKYNQAEAMGLEPKQKRKGSKPFFAG